MGKKGLSRDEKLQKVQELLHESKTAMTLKELEQKCNRDKGVVANTVKDIAQELVSDNLICCEKIGLSNYYWSFPSQALVVRRSKEAALQESIASKKRRRDELVAEEDQLEAARVDDESTARTEKLQKLAALRDEEARHEATLRNLQAKRLVLCQVCICLASFFCRATIPPSLLPLSRTSRRPKWRPSGGPTR